MTKRSTANADTKKHPASNVAAESTPHRRHVAKACDNNTQTIPNNMVLCKDWQHAGGARDLQSATVFPGILHSVTLARVLLFVKAAPFFAKRSLQQSHFRGRKHIGFLDSKKWSSPVQHVDVCVILPAFCGFMVSGELLKQLGVFRASCRNPKNRIATRSNGWIWRARFWSRLLLK